MIAPPQTGKEQFDEFSGDYDIALAHGISVSGEDKNYFARGRIAWLGACIRQLQELPSCVMDFGCGTGSAVPFLLDLIGVSRLTGVDVSSKSLEIARRTWDSKRSRFLLLSEYEPAADLDLIFCNGVFHHIRPKDRATKLDYVYRSLRQGGLFAFWENNPWNPGTRYVMKRIPFDRDAVTLSSLEASRLLRSAGFQILRTDYLFIFPRFLRWFRALEPLVARLPLGAQYQILCRKP